MSDQLPEMIPMPGNPSDGGGPPPPASFERQLSPDEERSVVLNFMGNMYGEAKKIDGNIIGEATTLKRGAGEEIKKQIEQVYAQPRGVQPQHAAPVQDVPSPQPVAVQPQIQAQQQVILPQPSMINDNQLAFNFDVNEKDELFLLLEKTLTRIDRLHKKVDDLTDIVKNSKVTSLPIKRQTKKKSVDNKEEV